MRQFKDSVSSQFSQTSQKTTSIRVFHFNYYLLIKDLYRSTNLPMTKVSGPSNIFFDQRTVKEPNSETLLRLAELVLTLNCFSFGGNYYKQTNGVAMGTKMGPSYANLFVGFIEHQFFSQYHGPKPELYGRYIDDCIGATSSTKEELTQFITAVNSFHPALKYT